MNQNLKKNQFVNRLHPITAAAVKLEPVTPSEDNKNWQQEYEEAKKKKNTQNQVRQWKKITGFLPSSDSESIS
jgi:hypothetical protein